MQTTPTPPTQFELSKRKMMTKLKAQLIHDEANSSMENRLGEAEVYRQMEISFDEYIRKLEIFKLLVGRKDLKGDFTTVVHTLCLKTKHEFTFFTFDGASLTVALTTYPGGKSYLGTRGSPTKLLTGQNLVAIDDNARIDSLKSKLECSKFEARSIIGFVMIKNTVRDSVKGGKLFTPPEAKLLRELDISVFSVGYATYLDFGPNRDSDFHLLTYLANAKVNVEGDSFPIADFLSLSTGYWRAAEDTKDEPVGTPKADVTPKDTEALKEATEDDYAQGVGWRGRLTGLLLKKKVNNVLAYQQMMYLKEDEVESKKDTSGRRNMEELMFLSSDDKAAIKSNLVRVDNVFYRESLTAWLTAFDIPHNPKRITIKDIAPLFEDPDLIRRMTRHMSNELGLRLLLLAPTMDKIEAFTEHTKSPLDFKEKAFLRTWFNDSNASVITQKNKSKKIVWPNLLKTREDRALHKKLVAEHYLDITLPISFYRFLNEVRGEFFLTIRGREALADERIGYYGKSSLAFEAPKVRALMNEKVTQSIIDLKINLSLDLPAPERKRVIATSYKEASA